MESTIILRKKFTNHLADDYLRVADDYLRVVLALWSIGETLEFSTHIENSSGSEPFLVEGHYFRDFNQALNDFNDRGLITLYSIKGVPNEHVSRA